MRIGRMLYSDSSKKTDKAVAQLQVFKRPHGVAVQNLGDYLTSKESDTEEKEFNMKVCKKMLTTCCYLKLHINCRFSKVRKKISINSTNSLLDNLVNATLYPDTI